ncbi:hypothetical protein BK133_00965 [Paenibacillus sp. FSL H8-0548]|uniref:hypothetical protein n=1 Tax=Paenibacillus sp. FSL H8-0548 TaxID=1920422 RepID=UPI00096D57B1|nr:hypothetical protein [Paenibacillus sp. FSL H8-0548]OMF38805.1 hypothetical protein BK133_00965 [Paenibacillus sp. FSL H8-0548]
MTIQDIKRYTKMIIDAAKKMGFTVQRYDAYSTNSVYLKLDYGVSNSIRISDHKGKKHLSYRFNLLTNLDKGYVSNGEHLRNYYSPADFEKLLHDIQVNRDNLISRYGEVGYKNFMNKNKFENANKKGFWSQAKLV